MKATAMIGSMGNAFAPGSGSLIGFGSPVTADNLVPSAIGAALGYYFAGKIPVIGSHLRGHRVLSALAGAAVGTQFGAMRSGNYKVAIENLVPAAVAIAATMKFASHGSKLKKGGVFIGSYLAADFALSSLVK